MSRQQGPRLDWSLYTDLYQLTMAEGYSKAGKGKEIASFSMYFRNYPFNGGYAISCGIAQLAQMVSEYGFSEDDVAYLASLDAPGGSPMFGKEFLDSLLTMELSVDIDAAPEGTVIFPYEPIVRVTGPVMQCQMLETALLNCVNFQTLIATKAARVCQAAGDAPVTEFGLRRAQGLGGLWASRASVVGGCSSTSDVLAGKLFGIPVAGTHSHSWVMSFDSEIEAFREFAKLNPDNISLLVDTYNVEEGIGNAIEVALELKAEGKRVRAIRIDSGDLAWLAKYARQKLDAAGLEDVGIMLTNDLDEYTIKSIIDEGAPVDIWGVGTKLASAYDQPTLGGVYKLNATKDPESDEWTARLKVSESSAKLTMPGVLDVRRYFGSDGKLAGDMVYDMSIGVNTDEVIVDPQDPLRRKELKGKRYEQLLEPLARDGKVVVPSDDFSAMAARERAKRQLSLLDETQLRMLNPHTYPVGMDVGMQERRVKLAHELSHGKE